MNGDVRVCYVLVCSKAHQVFLPVGGAYIAVPNASGPVYRLSDLSC